MLELIQQIVFNVTGKTGVTPETDFIQDLELNSFDIMNIVSAFEDHFNYTIPNRDIWKMKVVQDVIDYIRDKGIADS